MLISRSWFWISLTAFLAQTGFADTAKLTFLHTNDLHSHFRPIRTPGLNLGGIARMKTAVDQVRAELALQKGETFFLDGGDWSEGSIYFTADTGQSSLRLLDSLGYDAMVVGNHDWLVGPDQMLDTLKIVKPKLIMLSANLDPTGHPREAEFRKAIVPSTIITRNIVTSTGAKRALRIGLVGISTFELIYDDFVSPIKITDPFKTVRAAAQAMRNKTDIIVGISHNRIAMNADFLKQIPELDFIVGAHDHVKLVEPVMVPRTDGTQGFIVETGAWGEFLGRVDLTFDWGKAGRFAGAPAMSLNRAKLIQIDDTFAEDPSIARALDDLELRLTKARGPIFTQKVATSEIDINDRGSESLLGNLVTDAYLTSPEVQAGLRAVDPAGAKGRPIDVALEHAAFTNGIIPSGDLTDADLFDAHPSVWDPVAQRSWTVHTFDISGRSLAWLLNLLLSVKPHSSTQTIAVSGIEVLFNPSLARDILTGMGVGTPAALARPQADATNPFNFTNSRSKALSSSTAKATATETKMLMALNDPIGWAAKEIKIGGQPIDLNRTYRVASSEGIIYALHFVERFLPGAIVYSNILDTGVEAWRALKSRVVQVSPLGVSDIPYGNRLRRYQNADLGMVPGDVRATSNAISVTVTNYGTVASRAGIHDVGLDVNMNGRDQTINPKLAVIGARQKVPALKPGQSVTFNWSSIALPPLTGKWAEIQISLNGDASEINQSRNIASRFVPINTLVQIPKKPRRSR